MPLSASLVSPLKYSMGLYIITVVSIDGRVAVVLKDKGLDLKEIFFAKDVSSAMGIRCITFPISVISQDSLNFFLDGKA